MYKFVIILSIARGILVSVVTTCDRTPPSHSQTSNILTTLSITKLFNIRFWATLLLKIVFLKAIVFKIYLHQNVNKSVLWYFGSWKLLTLEKKFQLQSLILNNFVIKNFVKILVIWLLLWGFCCIANIIPWVRIITSMLIWYFLNQIIRYDFL